MATLEQLKTHIGRELVSDWRLMPNRSRTSTIILNYGFDKIRFIRPVPVGKQIRARRRLLAVDDRGSRAVLKFSVTIEVEGSALPHVMAEWLGSAQKKSPHGG